MAALGTFVRKVHRASGSTSRTNFHVPALGTTVAKVAHELSHRHRRHRRRRAVAGGRSRGRRRSPPRSAEARATWRPRPARSGRPR
eukprot:2078282-Pleurochrysis_carterae.AAC.1